MLLSAAESHSHSFATLSGLLSAGGQGSKRHGVVGGNGGDVIVETTRAADLSAIAGMPSTLTAEAGGHALPKREGARGADIVLPVPVGTIITAEGGSVGRFSFSLSLTLSLTHSLTHSHTLSLFLTWQRLSETPQPLPLSALFLFFT